MKVKTKRRICGALYAFAMAVVCILCTFPFFWMLSISLKEQSQAYDPSVWLFSPIWDNYKNVFVNRNLMKYLFNSLVTAVVTTVISMVLGCLAAYGFARFRFDKQENLAFWVLSLRMLPPMATVLPFFVMASLCHVLDTRLVLIIVYMLFNIPFTIWMMRGFFEDIPCEIEEAARVDGCSLLQALQKVVLPMALPGMVATAIFCIINSWNEFCICSLSHIEQSEYTAYYSTDVSVRIRRSLGRDVCRRCDFHPAYDTICHPCSKIYDQRTYLWRG